MIFNICNTADWGKLNKKILRNTKAVFFKDFRK